MAKLAMAIAIPKQLTSFKLKHKIDTVKHKSNTVKHKISTVKQFFKRSPVGTVEHSKTPVGARSPGRKGNPMAMVLFLLP